MNGPSKDSPSELFGVAPRRRPLKSRTMLRLARIYSVFAEHNPFANYPQFAQTPGVVGDGLASTSEKGALGELVGPVNGKVSDVSMRTEANNGGSAGVVVEGDGLDGSEMIIDESGGKNDTQVIIKMTSVDKETNDQNVEVQEDLLGVERMLMEVPDDLSQLRPPDEDVNFDLFDDLGSFFNTDFVGNDFVPVESKGSGELHEGNMKEDFGGEKKRKEMESQRSTLGASVASHAQVSVEIEISNCSKVLGTHPEDVEGKQKKTCKEKFPQDLSLKEGASSQRSEVEGETALVSKFVDKSEKGHESGSAEKGHKSGSAEKGHKSGLVGNAKPKKVKKADSKDSKSRKSKHLSVEVESSKSTKSGGSHPVIHGNMLNQNVFGTGNCSMRKIDNCLPESREITKYSREKLLHLQQVNKMAFIPEDIVKAVQEIGAELFGVAQASAAVEFVEASGFGKGELGPPTEANKSEDKDPGTLKTKKRGSSSEAKKEKKKRKRREKRAEMNRKLGVKRLKLKPPILKPKVVPHCRHYLKGRCQEGEKCKFSHDVIPLTKSKPCCHFARQACMKGDDCPFDHQLSKYPCNNYVTAGFCGRGDSCLFSHKIQKKGSEPTIDFSNETKSLDQPDKSNSKQPLDANVFSSSGISTPKNLKENSGIKSSQPAKAPKGLSFLPFGKSPLDNSAKVKEVDSSQQSCGSAGTGGEPNQASERSVDFRTTLMESPTSRASRGIGFFSFGRVDSSGDKTKTSPPTHTDSSNCLPFGRGLLHASSTDKQVDTSRRSDAPAEISDQLNQGTSSRGINLHGIIKDTPPAVTPKGISFSFLGRPSYDSGDESQTVFSNGHTDSQICMRGQGRVNESDKLKAVQQEDWASPTLSGQSSIKVGGGPIKSTSITAQKALLSTLAFAARYKSGIKESSAAATKELNNSEETSGGSACRQNESTKASAILDFLYNGDNKQKH